MSPILIRPVREQLEHDRLVRYLQQKYKRKFDVALNMGEEQAAPVRSGSLTLYPDLVLSTGRKLAAVVEVESGESVNNLEAMAQWVHFARARVPFHLYVPVQAYETARRLCEANQAQVTELWTYRAAADGFDLVRMSTSPAVARNGRPARQAASPSKPLNGAAAPRAAAKPSRKPSASAARTKRTSTRPSSRSGGARKKAGATSRTKARAGASRRR